MIDPLLYFYLMLKASLFSTGGMGNLPAVRDDLVLRRGWASDEQIAASLSVGQITPGPNGLWVVSLGFLVDGLRGALVTTLAISLPPLLILLVERLFHRLGGDDHPAVRGFVRGLGLAGGGAFAVTLIRLLVGHGLDAASVFFTAASIALVLSRRVPPVAILLLAALAGALLLR